MRRTWVLRMIALLAGAVLIWLATNAYQDPRYPDPAREVSATPRASPDPVLLRGREGAAKAPAPRTDALEVPDSSDIWGEELRFHVVDEATGMPIEGALVHVSAGEEHVREAWTDAAGFARIAKCRANAGYTVYAVRKVGYGVRWLRGAAAEEEVELKALDPLPGRVVDLEGRPIAGAKVVALDGLDKHWNADLPLVTDAEGRFTVAGVRWREAISLVVTARGYARRLVHAFESSEVEVVVTLGAGAVVEGVVVDESGRPVPGAQVTAQGVADAHTDDNGRYRLEGFEAPMEVRLRARGPEGRLGQSAPFALRSPEARREIRLEVRKVGSLEVVALDGATGERVTPRYLDCSLEGAGGRPDSARLISFDREDKQACFPDLVPGRYTVRVVPDYWGNKGRFLAPPSQTVQVEEGAPTRLEVRLEAGMEARGRISDPHGEVREARVVFQSSWKGVPQECCAEAEGAFRLAGVPPGPGTLILRCARSGIERSWEIVEAKEDLGAFVLPRGGIVEGHLPDVPVARSVAATISGGHRYSREGRDVYPGADGRFRIEHLPTERPFDLHLKSRDRGERIWTDLLLAPGEVRNLGEISWQTRREATGRVLDADGLPVRGAKVTFYSRNGAGRGYTDLQGRFRITKPPIPCTGVRVDLDDRPVGLFPPPTRDGTASATLRLPRPGRLRVRFVRDNGEPMAGATFRVAWVSAHGGIDDDLSIHLTADGAGWIETLLAPGTWRPEIWGEIGGEIEDGAPDVSVEAGSSRSLVLNVR